MERVNRDLSDHEIISLIAEDPIGRNQEIAAFLSLIDKVQGGYSFFINASWGDGKTVFVKQVVKILKNLNENLPTEVEVVEAVQRSEELKRLGLETPCLPVYYNAWRNDSLGDPLPSLIATITTEYDFAHSESGSPDVRQVATGILDTLLSPIGDGIASTFVGAFTGEDYLKSFKEKRGLQEKVAELIDAALYEKCDRLVLFIDELDRCSPAFALRLLEEIKFLFENDHVILVFSTDFIQLSWIVTGAYGPNFDGERYLARFYDRLISLTPSSCDRYLISLGIHKGKEAFNLVVHDITNFFGFPMRATNCYLEALTKAGEFFRNMDTSYSAEYYLLVSGLLPVLHAIKLLSMEDYNEVVSSGNYSSVLKYLEISSVFKSMSERTMSEINGNFFYSANYSPESDTLVRDLCALIFPNNKKSNAYLEAQERLGAGDELMELARDLL